MATERKAISIAAGKDLTDMQWNFVKALASGSHDPEEAAIEAGYSEHSAARQAYELLAKDHVKAAYVTLLGNRMMSMGASATDQLAKLLENARSERVRMEVAQDVLDRLGLRASEKIDHRVSGEVSVSIDLS
jgi:phage terminase small subunit